MTFVCLKLVGSPLTPVIGENTLPRIISIKRARPLQAENAFHFESSMSLKGIIRTDLIWPQVVNEGHKLQAIETVFSRRDTMISLTAGTLSGIAFFTAQPANGRVVKPETRRKIFEKLEKLREEAGVSKPKTGSGKNSSPAAESSGKATKLQSSSPSLNSMGSLVRPLGEATLP
ncbi:uncharacterized protein LOC107429326 isoform X2 [Ziziphus jujuba]|uniref:Uncharacterized protein LOC107429326 isoform X2 n=1 Tax=Ziziphus jujuba TaxID=326968 RepID=A0ABM3I108_ZIZJJ|nr:uncharacterized protein LOC107429326 isoform X2 [Ziziphus jujuba]